MLFISFSICYKSNSLVIEFYKNGRKLYLNTGWSSSLNAEGRRLLTQEAYLVTAHGIK